MLPFMMNKDVYIKTAITAKDEVDIVIVIIIRFNADHFHCKPRSSTQPECRHTQC